MVDLSVVDRKGKLHKISAEPGTSLLDAILDNKIFIPHNCEGQGSCGTCAVDLDSISYSKVKKPSLSEEDVLDLVPNLTDTTRLSCRCKVDAMENATVRIPGKSRNVND